MIRAFLLFLVLLAAAPAAAQTYPPLTGRVVDNAHVLSPDQIASLTQKLDALQRASSRQLVVATVPDLEGRPIEDYGVGLIRAWGIGQRGANNGIILIVAPNEHKVRIEVGYGLEGIVTDALSSQIIRNQIVPRFRDNDIPGGIVAGTDALIQQLQAPPEAAEAAAVAAQQAENRAKTTQQRSGGSFIPILFVGFIFFIILISAIGAGLHGQRYRGKAWGRRGVSVWGPGYGGGGSGLGWMLLGAALSSRNGGGSSWGGGGSDWGGGGGGSWGGGGGDSGFSGGGGSGGGGGASGSW